MPPALKRQMPTEKSANWQGAMVTGKVLRIVTMVHSETSKEVARVHSKVT